MGGETAGQLLLAFPRVRFPGFWVCWSTLGSTHYSAGSFSLCRDSETCLGAPRVKNSCPPEAAKDFKSAGGSWRFVKIAGWSSFCGQALAMVALHFQCSTAELPRACCRWLNKQTRAKLRPGDKWWGCVTLELGVRGKTWAAAEDLV